MDGRADEEEIEGRAGQLLEAIFRAAGIGFVATIEDTGSRLYQEIVRADG